MRLLLVAALMFVGCSAEAWDPPIGVPLPPSSLMPDRFIPEAPAGWPGSQVTGAYYIDNTSGSCNDSNTYGWPAVPRCSLPNANITLPAGGRIHLVGGGAPYTITSNRNWTLNGTEANPVVVTGSASPVISATDDSVQLGGSWIIIENITFNESRLIDNSAASLNNVLIRNSAIHNTTGTSGGCLNFSRADNTGYNENIVISNVEVGPCGPAFNPSVTNDIMCVQASNGARFWWIVDSHLHHCGGDSVRTGTNVGGGHASNRASDIYVGRNHMHDSGENAVDVKNSVRVVYSQNDMHTFPDGADAGAEIVTIHEGAVDTAFIFNRFYDGRYGINTTTSGGTLNGLYIIGNVFYDVHHYVGDTAYDEDNIGQSYGNAIVLGHGAGTNCHVLNNTFHDNDRNIVTEVNVTAGCQIKNNLFGTPKGNSWALGFENSTVHNAATVTHNLFDTGTYNRAQIGSTIYTSLASYTSAHPSKCSGCLSGDPLFVNEAARDYALQAGSMALNVAESAPSGYAVFQSVFGLSIEVDILGTARPQGSGWDLGAYERVTGGPNAPGAPSIQMEVVP